MQPEQIRRIFENAGDFEEHTAIAGGQTLSVFFIDGLVASAMIADSVIRPLNTAIRSGTMEEVYEQAKNGAVWCASVSEASDAQQVAMKLVNGFCVVVFPGLEKALCFETRTPEKRSVSAPEAENTVRGAKDAFTETMRTNTSLIRRHLRTPNLRLEQQVVGRKSLTFVSLCYIDGVSDMRLVSRMRTRLQEIDVEALLSPAAVEETVTGSRKTAFPMLQYTERTDKFCQGLLSGQIGLIVDGLPQGFLAPVDLGRLMRSPEDETVDHVSATAVRVLRYLALAASLLLPAVYAAMAMYHQQMIPTQLLRAIIESKQDVPFPTILEVLGLLAAFEILQEAGLHLPQAIGTAVSIIGGLVVGSAAVEAKIISPAALIVTAAAGICGFALPERSLSEALRLWRFALTILGGFAGLFGVTVGCILLLLHLAGLRSLGEAYLAPFSSVRTAGALSRRRFFRKERKNS